MIRPIVRIILVIIPNKALGRTIFQIVAILLAPNAKEASRNSLGTAFKESSTALTITGRTTIVKVRPALIIVKPNPRKSINKINPNIP